jgi:hypothetical protein
MGRTKRAAAGKSKAGSAPDLGIAKKHRVAADRTRGHIGVDAD